MNDVLFDLQRKIILDAAEKEDCVIVGRCANHILDNKCLSVFIHAPFEYRVQTVIERTGREEKSAQKLVKKVDKERRTYYEYFTDKKWKDISQYHLAFDSSKFEQEIINLILCWRTSLYVMFKFTGACTYTQFSCFSAVSLADADFRVQFLEKAVIFKHFQSRDEITIAGTAGFYFFYCILKFYHFS